jgi:peptide/nickel transport system substrate-binding protein
VQKNVLYGLVAVVVVAIVVVAAAAVILTAPKNQLAIELWYNNDGHYGDTEALLAQTLQQSIQACGKVTVTLKSDTWAVYKQNWASGRMPLFLLGWYPDYFDSDDYVSPFLAIAGAKSLGSFYNNSQVDQWVTQEQTTTSDATRVSSFASIQDQLAADVPYIPLFSGRADVEYNKSVTNVVLHPVVFKWFVMDRPGRTQLNASTTDKIISLDPASAYDYFSIEVINQVFDTLLVYDWQTTTLKPGLATEIPTVANGGVSADGMTYTYHLRQGVTFQDGSAFNASVVKRAIDRTIRLDLPGSAAFLLYDVGKLGRSAANGNNTAVDTITVPDDYNITFHLSQPVSFFNDLMAFSVAAPVPWDYSQTGEQPSTVGSVIGTGPYALTQHTVNQLVELTKFDNYYNPGLYAPAIPSIPVMDKVVINIRSSSSALKSDITTQAVDVIYRTPTPTDLADLQTNAATLGITVKIGASPQIRYLVFNVNNRAADAQLGSYMDVRIRQAIAYSVDRAQIASTVFNNQVVPLYSMVPPQLPYSQPVFQSAYGDHNCNSANSLLSQLGYAVGVGPTLFVARDE